MVITITILMTMWKLKGPLIMHPCLSSFDPPLLSCCFSPVYLAFCGSHLVVTTVMTKIPVYRPNEKTQTHSCIIVAAHVGTHSRYSMKQIPPAIQTLCFSCWSRCCQPFGLCCRGGSCWHCYHCVSCSACQLPLFYSPCPPRRMGETSVTSRPDDRQLLSARGCYGRPFMAQRKPVSVENHNGPTTHLTEPPFISTYLLPSRGINSVGLS